jgi:hypothetical protein
MVEEITVDGAPFFLEHINIPLDKIELDEFNPRIQYRLALDKGSKTIEQTILSLPEVTKLRKDIELNGGLREKIIVQKLPNGKFKVLEGNCRTVCFRSLQAMEKYKGADTWDTLPARVVPSDVEERKIAILLSDLHVAGKIEWKAHEKAGQIFKMNRDLKMTESDIATYLRQSKSTVSRFLNAYGFMKDKFFTIDGGAYADDGERKWSFFDEFYRSKDLREEYKRNPEFGEDFCRWVGEGRLPEGIDVRSLHSILKHPDAKRKFDKMPADTAFKEAIKIVEQAEPEQGSDFFKLLGKVRDSLTSAAQVKEILRIRTDKVARDKLLETYEAMRDFMRLADVDPDEAAASTIRKKAA